MKKPTKYTNEPIKIGKAVHDFLPPPSALVLKEPATVKVTLELTKDSLAFFKKHAKRYDVPYQRMLRGLIDTYAKHHSAD